MRALVALVIASIGLAAVLHAVPPEPIAGRYVSEERRPKVPILGGILGALFGRITYARERKS